MDTINMDKQNNRTDDELPEELNVLLDGIEVGEELKTKEYKTLREEIYESRNIAE
jgi:hypothetical protein